MRIKSSVKKASAVLAIFTVMLAAGAAAEGLNLIPLPKTVERGNGELALKGSSRIAIADASLLPLEDILREDIRLIHGQEISTSQNPGRAGDIVLRLDDSLTGDAYRLAVTDRVVVSGGNYNAVAFGMMTLLQAVDGTSNGLVVPRMRVDDDSDREFRALQVTIRSGYHSPEWVKRVIDLMRFYKVRILQLHTSQILDVGATMESTNDADFEILRKGSHAGWSKREMEEVIAYAKERGVLMSPQNEMRANAHFWPPTLTVDFNPEDEFADFVDEVDGNGKYEMPKKLADDQRFWNFLEVVTQRSYEQCARGWPAQRRALRIAHSHLCWF